MRCRKLAESSCLWAGLALVVLGLGATPVRAQEGLPEAAGRGDSGIEGERVLDTVEVTASPEDEARKTIGNTSGMKKADLERRNASHMSDLIDQISGASMNSLYSRPEVSVGVQGIAGHGRVSQQLESITQNFHAFTKDIGQTGSLLIDPQFLRSINVTRGSGMGIAALGSLGSSVNF
jgi:heme acquisition protein HasR